jgi:hypothetical protein
MAAAPAMPARSPNLLEVIRRCAVASGWDRLSSVCRTPSRKCWCAWAMSPTATQVGFEQADRSGQDVAQCRPGRGDLLMAGLVVLTLPVIIFFATERLLTGGLTAGPEKV